MDRIRLWQTLQDHARSGWLIPGVAPLTIPDPVSRVLWCGTGSALLPAEAVVQAFGGSWSATRWLPLGTPDLPASELPELRPEDQLVLASRSGLSLELWAWVGRLRRLPGWGGWRNPPLVMTADDGNPLAGWARSEGWPLVPLPADLEGSWSTFTPLSTVPLAWLGRHEGYFLYAGAEVSREAGRREGTWGRRVWEAVEAIVDAREAGTTTWTLLPYGARLAGLGPWWTQLVSEGLGRAGITAAWAQGPRDQHAQLQRWLGPREPGAVLLTLGPGPREEAPQDLPAACPYPWLARRRPSALPAAEALGTQRTLEAAGVPLIHWHLDEGVTETTLGSVMMAWQLVVALAGLALGADPYDRSEARASRHHTETLLRYGPAISRFASADALSELESALLESLAPR